jgi:hypothetical protein
MTILKIIGNYFILMWAIYVVIVCIYCCVINYEIKKYAKRLWIILPIIAAILLAWMIPPGIHALINILNTLHW